ncbi:MAG TPA: phospholipase D-like domain-containing protein [Terriglobales bacterium]|nr:phospholipase D-like domain-containing protein [Terriglobales bacterium]
MHRSRLLSGVVLAAVLASACARVQPHVTLPEIALGEPSFFPTLEAYAAAPIIGGNTVELLFNGEQIFPAKLAAIRAATKTITYAQYYYEEGLVSRDIAEALAERARAGVGVNVLLDSFGALGIPEEYVELMRRSGVHVVFFRPLRPFPGARSNNRMHRRVLVVDGRVAITGGSGVSRKWMGDGRTEGHWRETDVRIEGPVVRYLQGAFAENWLEATGIVLGGEPYYPAPHPPKGQAFVQIVRSSPAGGSFAVYTALLLAIASARKTIYITNPYFVLDEKMTEALLNAKAGGARVVVLVPGKIDHNLVRQASRASFGDMLKAGIEIHEYRAALLHAKTIVIDGVWATVGSTNLDNRSFALNDELNAIFYSPAVAQRLEQAFRDDLKHSQQVTYEAWSKRGVWARFLELVAFPIRDQL